MFGEAGSLDAAGPFSDLDRRFRKPLLAFFRRRVGAHHDPEDLTQEVFCRLLSHKNVRLVESIESYAFQVAANLLIDERRRGDSQGRRHHFDIAEALDGRAVRPELIDQIEPERILIAKERVAAALASLALLSPRTRGIFVLYRLEGMKMREIAALLGVSVSAIEKHLVKAVTHLTRQLSAPHG